MRNDHALSIPEEARLVLEHLNTEGFEAYLVGGWVRDCILHRSGQDMDITTNAQPDQILKLFSAFPRSEIGKNHGTIGVKIQSKWIEITTYRIDREIHDNRHPKYVEFTQQLQADVMRRDFTINALAMDKEGNIVDYVGGIEDIHNRIIRCVGNPHIRFEEDALRILRGLRLAAKLNFKLETETLNAMHQASALLNTLAKERIWNEWNQWMHTNHPSDVLMQSREIVREFFPEITDVPVSWIEHLDALHPLILRWMALCYHMTPEEVDSRLKAWKVPNHLSRDLKRRLTLVSKSFPSHVIELKYTMRDVHLDALEDALKFQKKFKLSQYNPEADQLFQVLLHEHACVKISQLDIRGHDLIKLGIHGVAIQIALDQLLDLVIEEKIPNRKEDLLASAKSLST